MKKILTPLLVLVSLAALAQTPVNRASQANTVIDARLGASLNFLLPRYLDTVSANLQLGVDSAGALIYTRQDGKVWKRTGSPMRWVEVGGASGVAPTFQAVTDAGNTTTNSFFVVDGLGNGLAGFQVLSGNGTMVVSNAALTQARFKWDRITNAYNHDLMFPEGAGTDTLARLADVRSMVGGSTDLSGYYTKVNLQTSGQSQVHWDNLTSKPAGLLTSVPTFQDVTNAGSSTTQYLNIGGMDVNIGGTTVATLSYTSFNTSKGGVLYLKDLNSTFSGRLSTATLTAARSYSLPDKAGTIALTSDITAGSGAAWGSITGTLSSQTDLQTSLNTKLNTTDTAGMLNPYLRSNVAAATYMTASYTESDPKRVSSLAFSGTGTKTLTLTLADATTVSNTFTDQGITAETDPLRIASAAYSAGTLTLTKADATTVTATGFPTNNNQLTNGSNYITTAGARTAISLTTTGTGGTPTYDNTTGVLNVPVIPTNTNQLTNGAGFVTATSTVSGSLLNVRFITSGTTYQPTAGTTKAVFHLMGGGGGGGGVTGVTSSVGAAAGGGAGGYLIKYATVSDATTYTIAIGGGGAGGANTGGNGVSGTQTLITIGGVTSSAAGGAGGAGQTANSTPAVALGGTAGSSTNGDIPGGGQNGDNGIRLSGTVGISGAGGTSLFGTGGPSLIAAGVGNNAIGYGSGGGGALSTANAAKAGGAGAPGVLIVYEYR